MNDREGEVLRYIFKAEDNEQKYRVLNEAKARLNCHSGPFKIIPKMIESYEESESLPSYEYFVEEYDYSFPVDLDEEAPSFAEVLDLIKKVAVKQLRDKLNSEILKDLSDASEDDVQDLIERTRATVDEFDSVAVDQQILSDEEIYEQRKNVTGLKSHIQSIDDRVDAFELGTSSCLGGYVGQFKSTISRHIAYENILDGYGCVFVSLEMPRSMTISHLLNRHYSEKFDSEKGDVAVSDIRKGELTEEQEEFMFDVVSDDLRNNEEYGGLRVLEPEHFSGFTLSAIQSRMAQIDFDVDFVIVDYVQLLKYEEHPFSVDHSDPINYYVRQFSKLQHDVDGSGKPAHIMMVSQVNRRGYAKAMEKGGEYDPTAISEGHTIERASSQIFFTFAPPDISEDFETRITLAKNRTGDAMNEPHTVSVNPELSQVGKSHDVRERKEDDDDVNVTSLLED